MDWDDLRFFLAVAQAGSLSGAAQQLNVNTTTVLRRVGSLEDDLGARLFERERTGYRLTPAGDRLVEALEPGAQPGDAPAPETWEPIDGTYGQRLVRTRLGRHTYIDYGQRL